MIRSGTTCYNDMYFAIGDAAAASSNDQMNQIMIRWSNDNQMDYWKTLSELIN